ncbi:dihydrodipicolinate synthase family protein, partial [Amycolatopsis sp. GM8]|uniref:dihydrodipicolinate synthase family protein n=1 Tax=Amycolatopsis sp. GM8 TaxID=2896530 RepID=UPI001F465D34
TVHRAAAVLDTSDSSPHHTYTTVTTIVMLASHTNTGDTMPTEPQASQSSPQPPAKARALSSVPPGLLNIMVTPFTPGEEVDVESLRTLTRWTVDAGVAGLVPLGIMGEAHKLSDRERDVVLGTVVDVAGDVPVVAGCTAESTVVAIERTRRAAEIGATAVMIAPPRAATTPTLQLAHYIAVADAGLLPIVIQDEPVTTGVTMTSATIGELCSVDGIAAVKVEQIPSPTKVSGILDAAPTASCYGGLGGLYLLEELDRGAVGIMTGFGYPEVLVDIHRRYAAGDVEGAWRVFHHWMPLIRYEAQLGVGGVALRKQLLAERGAIAGPTTRRPAAAGDERSLGELREMVSRLSATDPTATAGAHL